MNLKDLKHEMPEIFETVKKDVIKTLGWNFHRAGLRLGLAEMGMIEGGFIGGMFIYPGTDIVMNTSPLWLILETQPDDIVWAYTYHILLHEYIHSLGYIKEEKCEEKTFEVIEKVFEEENHPVLILAKIGIGYYIRDLQIKNIPPNRRPDGMLIEYVHGFDRESQSYYS
ncbi:MAG: hypothetical protein KGD70_11890 [Candidatus Lokiarchaeota archaeon]|jgi:hypothetical protein|nr:hypothetical protein [Candidatus Lokiarchaeota archaeon]